MLKVLELVIICETDFLENKRYVPKSHHEDWETFERWFYSDCNHLHGAELGHIYSIAYSSALFLSFLKIFPCIQSIS